MTRERAGRALRWLPLAVVAVELLLVSSGVIDLARAAAVVVLIEIALAGVVVAEAAALRAGYRTARQAGADRAAALSGALDAALPPMVATLVRQELRLFAALFQWLRLHAPRRRPTVGAVDTAVPYGRTLRTMVAVLSAVSIVEVVVVELVVPWAAARWTLAILGGYGLIWTAGFAASVSVSPHTVGLRRLRLRFGFLVDITVPMDRLASAREELAAHRTSVEYDDGTLSVSVLGVTDVCVELVEPYRVDLGRRGVHPVRRVRFQADDPQAAVRAIRAAIAAGEPAAA